MKIDDIKKKIENKEDLNNILIFNCKVPGSDFIFHQYINRFSDNNNYEIRYIESISEVSSINLFNENNIVYIYEIDNLDTIPSSDIIIWIKAKKVSKSLYKDNEEIIVDIPKIEDWQIKDYIDYNLPSLEEENKEKLFKHYKGNLFRLELEVSKIKLFRDELPTKYYQIEDQIFTDSSEYTIFNLTNCIIRRNIKELRKLKDEIENIDIDPFGLLTILIKNFRQIIDIQLAKNPTPEYVGVNNKQFWAIKNYSCGFYSKDELVYVYKFLLSLDRKIKSGYIPSSISTNYIICKILLL